VYDLGATRSSCTLALPIPILIKPSPSLKAIYVLLQTGRPKAYPGGRCMEQTAV
jgi:hypothetical protein